MKNMWKMMMCVSLWWGLSACAAGVPEPDLGEYRKTDLAKLLNASTLPKAFPADKHLLYLSANGFDGTQYLYVLNTRDWTLHGFHKDSFLKKKEERQMLLLREPQKLEDAQVRQLQEAFAQTRLEVADAFTCQRIKDEARNFNVDGTFPALTLGRLYDGLQYSSRPGSCNIVSTSYATGLFAQVEKLFKGSSAQQATEEQIHEFEQSFRCSQSTGMCRGG